MLSHTPASPLFGFYREAVGVRLARRRRIGGGYIAAAWSSTPQVTATKLPFPFPADINARGQVIGHGRGSGGRQTAFLWERGERIDLGSLGQGSTNLAINNRGQIVSQLGGGAALWTVRR